MSIAAIAWAKKQRCGSGTAKAVLVAVADYADEHGRAWPSQRTIAEETEFTDKTVRTALQDLETKGLISREERRRPDGSRAPDMVVLNLSYQPEALTPPPEAASPGVGYEVPGGGVTVSPLTTFEPPTDPRVSEKAREPAIAIRQEIVAACNEAGRIPPAMHLVTAWLDKGYDPEMVREVVVAGIRRGVKTLGYFNDQLADQHAQMLSERARPPPEILPPQAATVTQLRPRNEPASHFDIGRAVASRPPPGFGG